MGRWQPDARGRLAEAAMELYAEHGFDRTTAAEIAERAGLTERTFFRHFADKREVLFAGSELLDASLATSVLGVPAEAAPLEAVAVALEALDDFFVDLEHSRRRQAVIDANPSLQERELIKMSRLSATLAGALRERAVPPAIAALTAETGIVVFRTAFERWIAEGNDERFGALVRQILGELRAVTGAG